MLIPRDAWTFSYKRDAPAVPVAGVAGPKVLVGKDRSASATGAAARWQGGEAGGRMRGPGLNDVSLIQPIHKILQPRYSQLPVMIPIVWSVTKSASQAPLSLRSRLSIHPLMSTGYIS